MPRKDNHRRFEFLLNPDDPNEQELIVFLDALRDQKLSFKAYVCDLIWRDVHPETPATVTQPVATADNRLLEMLVVVQQRQTDIQEQQSQTLDKLASTLATPPNPTPDGRGRASPAPGYVMPRDEDPALTTSTGLDMSGPRRKATPRPATLPEDDTQPAPPFDPEASARLLVASINGYGKH